MAARRSQRQRVAHRRFQQRPCANLPGPERRWPCAPRAGGWLPAPKDSGCTYPASAGWHWHWQLLVVHPPGQEQRRQALGPYGCASASTTPSEGCVCTVGAGTLPGAMPSLFSRSRRLKPFCCRLNPFADTHEGAKPRPGGEQRTPNMLRFPDTLGPTKVSQCFEGTEETIDGAEQADQ
jgi:hypothetical protein